MYAYICRLKSLRCSCSVSFLPRQKIHTFDTRSGSTTTPSQRQPDQEGASPQRFTDPCSGCLLSCFCCRQQHSSCLRRTLRPPSAPRVRRLPAPRLSDRSCAPCAAAPAFQLARASAPLCRDSHPGLASTTTQHQGFCAATVVDSTAAHEIVLGGLVDSLRR